MWNPEHDIHYKNHGAANLLVYMSAATPSGKKVESLELNLKLEAANFVTKLRAIWAILVPAFMSTVCYLVISQLSRIPYRMQGNELLLWSVGKYAPISYDHLSERVKSQKQKRQDASFSAPSMAWSRIAHNQLLSGSLLSVFWSTCLTTKYTSLRKKVCMPGWHG